MVAVRLAIASAKLVPTSTFFGRLLNVIDSGFLSSAEVKPPIGSMFDCRKLMHEPSGTKKARILVLAPSAFRFSNL